jgi:hypothetical protein
MDIEKRLESIHDLVIKQGQDIAVIKSKIDGMPKTFFCQQHSESFTDHEERLRGLEAFKAQFKGALFIVAGLGGFLGALIGIVTELFKK